MEGRRLLRVTAVGVWRSHQQMTATTPSRSTQSTILPARSDLPVRPGGAPDRVR